MGAMRTWEPG
jgi:hypothetical protein